MKPEKIKVGVVGVGYLGKFHAEKYSNIPEVELTGVVDIDKKAADETALRFNTKPFYNYKNLFGKIDAVSIVVPTHIHYPVAKAFIEKGIDCLIEKPITTTIEEASDLVSEAEKRGVILQVGHLERFNPAITALSGIIDNPMFIESDRLAPFDMRGTDVCVVLDLMIHDIDIILNLVKADIRRVDSVGIPVISKEVDIANARIEFSNGCVANVTASRISREKLRKMRLFQHNGYISIDFIQQKITILKKPTDTEGVFPKIGENNLDIEKGDSLLAEIKAFIHSVAARTEPPVTGKDGKRALEVALRIKESLNATLPH
ncbi:MAG: UDP-N-acetyl-D-glucosamine dehydrogenase [Deltaproteobacteria bacterium GWC2_42_11]|nr:MAG: UDP-N-acetyl-D-glucosamine dehydrogenase [Deltaproteobacteria bacterium GWC2_42_11]HBO85024.1 UDP-N-acetyl-D-glucosamine dehydrogenase [Deltaproteobacteria bacterium]